MLLVHDGVRMAKPIGVLLGQLKNVTRPQLFMTAPNSFVGGKLVRPNNAVVI